MTQYANNNAAANTNENANKGNNSANFAGMIGCRIAGAPTYTPAHIKPGAQKPTQARCTFNVFQNIRGRSMVFAITVWGKLADSVARGGATGKEVEIFSRIEQYRGRVFLPVPDGQQPQYVLKADGTPLEIDKVGFTVEKMIWGMDSAKTIQEEINAGIRPAQWNNPAHPDHNAWLQECARRNSMTFQQGQAWFGYAKVRQPIQGSQIVDHNVASQGAGGQGYGTQYQGNPGAVNNGFTGNQGGQAPAAGGQQPAGGYQANTQTNGYQANTGGGQPVNVNGQDMGYTMPQNNGQQQNNGYAPQGQPTQPAGTNCAPAGGAPVSM